MNKKSTRDRHDLTRKYGFYGRLKAEFPSQVIVDVTERCNLACVHCAHRTFKKSSYYSGCFLPVELNAKLADEIGQCSDGLIQYIRYTAEGEPLLHPHIFEMLEYAVRNSRVMVTLTTNGMLMNGKRIERLLATGAHMIDISIDAITPETYAKIRVNGDLNVTRANVLSLIKIAKGASLSTKIAVSFIEQPENIHEREEFEGFWKDNGADYVVVRRLHSNAGSLVAIADAMQQEALNTVRRPCLYPWERIVLNPRGYLAFCPADWTHGSTIVDYRTAAIYETWQGEFYQQLRNAHLTSNFANHQFCGQCPDWKATRWPDEGRSYADMIEEFRGLD